MAPIFNNPFLPENRFTGGSTTGSKGKVAVVAIPFNENGGFLATNFFLMLPLQDMTNGAVGVAIFNTGSFDDANDASSYSYKIEDIVPGRVPTVRRVIVNYRDLGPATLLVTLTGTNDNAQQISVSASKSIGTAAATGDQFVTFVDIELTAFQPQLTIGRAAGGGPISIISATIIGEVEEVSL